MVIYYEVSLRLTLWKRATACCNLGARKCIHIPTRRLCKIWPMSTFGRYPTSLHLIHQSSSRERIPRSTRTGLSTWPLVQTQPRGFPASQTLKEIATFFVSKLSGEFKTLLQEGALAASNACIRVGSTCSGSDICVSVLRECVAFLNQEFGTHAKVVHVFSCELSEAKRNLILKQHPDIHHLFDNVSVFPAGKGWCYKCNCEHSTGKDMLAIDWFYCGPSCKDLSTLNNARSEFAGCYQQDSKRESDDYDEESIPGTSGVTYLSGFKKVPCLELQHLECC